MTGRADDTPLGASRLYPRPAQLCLAGGRVGTHRVRRRSAAVGALRSSVAADLSRHRAPHRCGRPGDRLPLGGAHAGPRLCRAGADPRGGRTEHQMGLDPLIGCPRDDPCHGGHHRCRSALSPSPVTTSSTTRGHRRSSSAPSSPPPTLQPSSRCCAGSRCRDASPGCSRPSPASTTPRRSSSSRLWLHRAHSPPPSHSWLRLVGHAGLELAGGAVIGLAIGWVGAQLMRRVASGSSGLFSIGVMALTVLAYAAAATVHTSGFIACYLAALLLGNLHLPHRPAVQSFATALGWVAQIGLFVLLGLLATPHGMASQIVPAVVVGLALLLLARPLSVAVSVSWFRFPVARAGVPFLGRPAGCRAHRACHRAADGGRHRSRHRSSTSSSSSSSCSPSSRARRCPGWRNGSESLRTTAPWTWRWRRHPWRSSELSSSR